MKSVTLDIIIAAPRARSRGRLLARRQRKGRSRLIRPTNADRIRHAWLQVYDVTAFLNEHPAGPGLLTDFAGGDATGELIVHADRHS